MVQVPGSEADFVTAMWVICRNTDASRSQLIAAAESLGGLPRLRAVQFVDSTVRNVCPGKALR